ncbi:MAG: DUF2892 domain-containing protein [Acidobacteria bacterium]|nr:DUF2892 domain-containing protein [Acidobacteriota bacterium]
MNVERMLRMIAGALIVLSVVFAKTVDPRWYWFTAFIGLNLFQSAFSNWCPMMTFLMKLGVKG